MVNGALHFERQTFKKIGKYMNKMISEKITVVKKLKIKIGGSACEKEGLDW